MLTYMLILRTWTRSPSKMLRTTIYLEEETALALRRLSATQSRPQSELIREAINTYIAQSEGDRPRSLPPGAGKYCGSHTDVSVRAEQILKRRARERR